MDDNLGYPHFGNPHMMIHLFQHEIFGKKKVSICANSHIAKENSILRKKLVESKATHPNFYIFFYKEHDPFLVPSGKLT